MVHLAPETYNVYKTTYEETGIGVADITKLKANGFYTVAVPPSRSLVPYHFD